MLDATGKIPDGIVADSITNCDLLDRWVYHDYCHTLPNNGSDIDFTIPKGNTVAMGSFDGCLKIEATHAVNDSSQLWGDEPWDDFTGQHCMIYLFGLFKDPELIPHNDTAKQMRDLVMAKKSSYTFQPRMGLIPGFINDHPAEDIYEDVLGTIFRESHLKWGKCIPSGCTYEDVTINYAFLYNDLPALAVPISCHTSKDQEAIKDLDTLDIVMM